MDPERIRAVEEWLPPFIKNYLRIAAPLLNLLKTGKNKKEIGVKVRQTNVIPAPFPLSETVLEAFKALKEAFTSAPLLRYFDKNKPIRVETDTSAFAIGGILTQQFKINSHLHWLPVTYYSKKLLDMETQYGTGKKNPADGLLRRPDYKVPKASTTSTAAEMMQQSFCLGSNDYKPVQEKLYILAVMTLRPRCPVRQVRQQEDVVPDMNMDVGMEDGSTATVEESSMRHLPAQEASRNGDGVIQQDNVVPNINMDVRMDGGAATAEESLVQHLPA
ncbi:hypothetical protein LPUS_10373 [Lasallia pustulata]|uniref:Reverse transcriptase/retrotransposon-derived protein RNase H-like domain-containing protein n=1 Tax=Lasallia pustulata TaxID=136370 RepID=A0A1W5DA01_9LECA|nr:hypothetical protein LPUS_10373 [Lasallia pustulata]